MSVLGVDEVPKRVVVSALMRVGIPVTCIDDDIRIGQLSITVRRVVSDRGMIEVVSLRETRRVMRVIALAFLCGMKFD